LVLRLLCLKTCGGWQYNRVFLVGEIGTDENFGDKTGVNKMNCELIFTYDTHALRQTGSRNLTRQKTLPTIWGTYMKLVTKYQISAINSC
jgi:hypothetical protein